MDRSSCFPYISYNICIVYQNRKDKYLSVWINSRKDVDGLVTEEEEAMFKLF